MDESFPRCQAHLDDSTTSCRATVIVSQSPPMTDRSPLAVIIENWWESFPSRSRSRGNIAGGLVILENLRDNFDLDIEAHKATGSDQLRNASRQNVQKILARYGEERILSEEGGRTNRGLMKNLQPLLQALADAGIDQLPPDSREREIGNMQAALADKARDILNTEKISFDYRVGMTSREIVGKILASAGERLKTGEVAEYLIGAKLSLRFPNYGIRNSAASAADRQTEEQGDFQINDCVFHVSVAPNRGHYDKCKRNLADGLRVFLLVPDDMLVGARQNAQLDTNGRVSVESIESFVSQNIEELSDFAGEKVAQNMRRLLDKYNQRVAEVETDLSLQIRIPVALEK